MNDKFLNQKGSEWHKWDLHIHTPASYDWRGGDISPDDLIKKAIESELKVIAITALNFCQEVLHEWWNRRLTLNIGR